MRINQFLVNVKIPLWLQVLLLDYCVCIDTKKGRQRTIRQTTKLNGFVRTKEYVLRQKKDYVGGATFWSSKSIYSQCNCTMIFSILRTTRQLPPMGDRGWMVREGVSVIEKWSCKIGCYGCCWYKCFDNKMVKLPGRSYIGSPPCS